MNVATVGDRTFMVAILALMVASMGFATSVMAMWFSHFFPPPPPTLITRESLDRLRRLHDSDARSTTSTEPETHPRAKRMPSPPMKKPRSRSQPRPRRHVSFNDPETVTSTATVTLTLVNRLKAKRRTSPPARKCKATDDVRSEDTVEDRDGSPLSSSETLPHQPRRPNLLRIATPWKSSRHTKHGSLSSIGSVAASSAASNVTEFGERPPPRASRVMSFGGRKSAARETAPEGPQAETERERGRFAWKLKRAKTIDPREATTLGDATPADSGKPGASRPQMKRFSTSPMRIPKFVQPSPSAAPPPAPPSPPASLKALTPIITAAAPAPRPATPGGSPPCPSRRLSSYISHALSPHTNQSPCPSPPLPQRTQPYGPPYNVMPPEAGVWAEKEGEERPRRAKRMSAPADVGAAVGKGLRGSLERRRGTEPVMGSRS